MTDRDSFEGRLNFRTLLEVQQAVEEISARSSWANDSQVARDMITLGIIHSELVSTEGVYPEESPIRDWERPQGLLANDDNAVCPECTQSNKWLFVVRRDPMNSEVTALQCLACGEFGPVHEFTIPLPEDYYWGKSAADKDHHIVNPHEEWSLCRSYDEGALRAGSFTPDIGERPTYICGDCWHEHIDVE